MTLEQSLKEICSGLTSVRVYERKKSAESLKDMLSRSAMPCLLTENTLKKSGYTWNQVFNNINEYILKEAEKYEKNKKFDNIVAISNSLLNLCLSGSNKGGAYIKCDLIMEACLFVFNDNRLRRAIGDAYYSILYKHVINKEHYNGYIKPSTWGNLLEACVNVCLSNSSHLDSLTKFKLLWLVIENASNTVQFHGCLRDTLSDLNKCFQKDDNKLQELIMKIFIILVELLSTECRHLISEFTESVLPIILKFYDCSMDNKKKGLLFKALSMAIRLHHPYGRLQSEEGSLAHNWDVWYKHLHSILEIICLEINSIQKTVKQNTKCEEFALLAAITYYQIFNENNIASNDGETLAKKAKLDFNKNKCFNDLLEELQHNPQPWIEIINMYVEQFKTSLTAVDYFSTIKTLEIIMPSLGKGDWKAMSKLSCAAIEYFVGEPEILTDDKHILFYELWNTAVKYATRASALAAVHEIIWALLSLNILKYNQLQPLLVLYFEKGMPVSGHTLTTLEQFYARFYSNCCSPGQRKQYLNWLRQANVSQVDVKTFQKVLLRLVCDENIGIERPKKSEHASLRDILFDDMETSVLFSHFEYDMWDEQLSDDEPRLMAVQVNRGILSLVLDYLNDKLTELLSQQCPEPLIESGKTIHLVFKFYGELQKYKVLSTEDIIDTQLYFVAMSGLKRFFVRSDEQIRRKMEILRCLQGMLEDDFGEFLNGIVRSCLTEECFHVVYGVLKTESQQEARESSCEEDVELDGIDLRQQCVGFVAAYCSRPHDYTDELLKFILDEDLYLLDTHSEVSCALRCLRTVVDFDADCKYLDSTFSLMKHMCRVLFRNAKATAGLLHILLKVLDRIWSAGDGVMRNNCVIMVSGYYERCNKLFYPTHLAALIYECAARVAELSRSGEPELDIDLTSQLRGSSNSLRIYCCYLLKNRQDSNGEEIQNITNALQDIFIVTLPTENEIVLRDETVNRTLAVLHCYRALSDRCAGSLGEIVFEVVRAQKQLSLHKRLTRKALATIAKEVTKSTFDVYVNNNILDLLYLWYAAGEKLDSLPLDVLGFESVDAFLERHARWLVAADALWACEGHVGDSRAVQLLVAKYEKPLEYILEMCFCAIITLCLPHIVVEKYKLEAETRQELGGTVESAHRMFTATRRAVGSEKWSDLFLAQLGKLVLAAAARVRDPRAAELDLRLRQVRANATFNYSKDVFSAMLRCFGELMDGDVMDYLAEKQPLLVLNILLKLYGTFVDESVADLRLLRLHTYITFVEKLALGFASDALLYGCALNSLTNAMSTAQAQQLHALALATKRTLQRLKQARRLDSLRESVLAKVLAALSSKDVDSSLLSSLMALRDGADSNFVYSRTASGHKCASLFDFEKLLKIFVTSLVYPSNVMLSNLKHFLKSNADYVNRLCKELDIKGFSEDCSASLVHGIINALTTILRSSNDDKVAAEACGCLAELATYDVKSLLTAPPADTTLLRALPPKQYFVYLVLATLGGELFAERPALAREAALLVHRVLGYSDGQLALEMTGINKEILQPLSPLHSDMSAEYRTDDQQLERFARADAWLPRPAEGHLSWLARMTTSLLSLIAPGHNCAAALSTVCALKATVSARVLPSVLGVLLDSNTGSKTERLVNTVGEQLNHFFAYIWDLTFEDQLANTDDAGSAKLDHDLKAIIQYMLGVIDFVRLQANNYQSKRPTPLNYLNMEYKRVAWAAALADSHLAAIYYGEAWAAAQNGGVPPPSPEATSNLDGGAHLQRIFRRCFVSIGEIDAVEGCGTAHLTSEEEKRKHLLSTGRFAESLLLHDIALSAGPAERALQAGVARCLHRAGLHHLALQYIHSCPESEPLDDVKYDCLSLLGDWSEVVDTRQLEQRSKLARNTDSVTKMYRYACLKDCLNIAPSDGFYAKLEQSINEAKLAVASLCKKLNMENSQCLYKVMAYLHLFRDIESYLSVRCGKESISALLDSWRTDKLPPYKDFEHLERLLSQRTLILQHSAENNCLLSAEINSLQLQYAELALANERVQMAQRVVAMVKRLRPSKAVALLESKVAWDQGHKDIALSLLHANVVDECDDAKLAAMSLRQYGLWMAECKRENVRDIIKEYLEKSLEVLRQRDDAGTRHKLYFDVAQFADAEYKQVLSYISSSAFENKMKCVESMKGTAASLKSSQQTLTRDEKKALLANNAFRQMDEAEIASTRAELNTFLHLALRYYLLSLRESDDNDLSVFRVISLWLANKTESLSGAELSKALQAVPSRKYVPVLPQLVPHLGAEDSPFARHLHEIILRCAKEHPHHTLPILFNLKNSERDRRYGKESVDQMSSPAEPRVATAALLVARLARADPGMAAVIAQMEQLCDAIISFAYFSPASKEIGKSLPIPKEEPIYSIGCLDSIPVPTDTIPLKRNSDYTNISRFSGFENCYEMVGGINFPKKINCRSSDGHKRILLIKGEDDMRQDAVMQQVFTIVNTLLEKNPITYHNKLLIRTYKVVALSRRAGVLQWCAGTTPLGTYLAHAHQRRRPQDISPNVARGRMKACQENKVSNMHKLAVFNEILRVFKPVFHYFFTENYLDPVTWYERRLAYTRSVATSSMVGYVMGLGDRHVQNILIDKKTAEVIHIDFGIAFDQGKTLPTPETVPFRLTQDIVAAFGCSGVEGIFRRCCEKTLQLLRDNQETLLTILEVLLCDPLYLWITSNAVKNQNVSGVESASGGGLAERALLGVLSKVSGAEGGPGGVSVRGQVAALLHRATDRANLCRLFHGWQPYL